MKQSCPCPFHPLWDVASSLSMFLYYDMQVICGKVSGDNDTRQMASPPPTAPSPTHSVLSFSLLFNPSFDCIGDHHHHLQQQQQKGACEVEVWCTNLIGIYCCRSGTKGSVLIIIISRPIFTLSRGTKTSEGDLQERKKCCYRISVQPPSLCFSHMWHISVTRKLKITAQEAEECMRSDVCRRGSKNPPPSYLNGFW